jgi:hypothetical protein
MVTIVIEILACFATLGLLAAVCDVRSVPSRERIALHEVDFDLD